MIDVCDYREVADPRGGVAGGSEGGILIGGEDRRLVVRGGEERIERGRTTA